MAAVATQQWLRLKAAYLYDCFWIMNFKRMKICDKKLRRASLSSVRFTAYCQQFRFSDDEWKSPSSAAINNELACISLPPFYYCLTCVNSLFYWHMLTSSDTCSIRLKSNVHYFWLIHLFSLWLVNFEMLHMHLSRICFIGRLFNVQWVIGVHHFLTPRQLKALSNSSKTINFRGENLSVCFKI